MRRIVLIILLFSVLFNAFGESAVEKPKIDLSVNLDVLSSHLWRGFKNGNSLSLQPTISASYNGWSFGTWAAYAGNGSYFEVDIFAEYSYKKLTVSIYDYFCPASLQSAKFFEFRKHQTKHTIDVMLTWEPERIPFKVMASTMIWGDDLSKTTGNQHYSTYIEPAITWKRKQLDGDLYAGFTPFNGYYSSDPSFVNLGASVNYNLNLQQFNIPIRTKVSYNPVLNTIWFMAGISISI
ncbi:MAG: hypothetical protein AB9846_18365 [Tenuifilaceae bacterium]